MITVVIGSEDKHMIIVVIGSEDKHMISYHVFVL
jgi:hypothetical protein